MSEGQRGLARTPFNRSLHSAASLVGGKSQLSRVKKIKKPEVHIQVFHIFLKLNFSVIKYQVPLLILRW